MGSDHLKTGYGEEWCGGETEGEIIVEEGYGEDNLGDEIREAKECDWREKSRLWWGSIS